MIIKMCGLFQVFTSVYWKRFCLQFYSTSFHHLSWFMKEMNTRLSFVFCNTAELVNFVAAWERVFVVSTPRGHLLMWRCWPTNWWCVAVQLHGSFGTKIKGISVSCVANLGCLRKKANLRKNASRKEQLAWW